MSTTAIPEPWSLKGKSALVTGGSRGIGRAIALYLVRKGVSRIAITYASSATAADDVVAQCLALGATHAVALRADALEPASWPAVVKDSLAKLEVPRLDVLVNNAVLTNENDYKPIARATAEDFSKVMVANVYVPLATTVAFLEQHAAAEGKAAGRVINISSQAGREANMEPFISYGASKAALDSYTRSLAVSFSAEKGVTFNTVVVGPTATESLLKALSVFPKEFGEGLKAQATVAHRLGEVEDIARIVGFLASDESGWVNGAAVSANGGARGLLAALG
ncbi:short-chain dehydrogenase reductase sdr [Colletotrichum sojae]|uniref:Short-chain dehydrogenase reductase sdr n=1 Tax=Colletotrichum sojae TaxID=2175907 RepID=A0A8H6JK74_9PEZI|nr:short-chain dehydrogenase reductase sdr [Colletotrichum sojae]